jgi:hypothetical protein
MRTGLETWSSRSAHPLSHDRRRERPFPSFIRNDPDQHNLSRMCLTRIVRMNRHHDCRAHGCRFEIIEKQSVSSLKNGVSAHQKAGFGACNPGFRPSRAEYAKLHSIDCRNENERVRTSKASKTTARSDRTAGDARASVNQHRRGNAVLSNVSRPLLGEAERYPLTKNSLLDSENSKQNVDKV